MNLYVAQPYERVRDRLMASLPPQPEFVPKALDVILRTMVTPKGVEVPPTATRKSSRVSKEPTQGSRAPEKRKRETSKGEDPLTSKKTSCSICFQGDYYYGHAIEAENNKAGTRKTNIHSKKRKKRELKKRRKKRKGEERN